MQKTPLIRITSALTCQYSLKFHNSFSNQRYFHCVTTRRNHFIQGKQFKIAAQKPSQRNNYVASKVKDFKKKFDSLSHMRTKIDKTSTRNGGEIVASILKSHGVKHVFTLAGGHISPILVESEKLGIRIIDTRQEVTTVFAADAVARLSGTVGVAVVTAGPGVTNTVTAVKNAQMAESPVLLLGGAAASILKGRGALQDIDQLSLFKSVCKYTATVTSVRDIGPTLKEAMSIAQSGTPGPVFVEFPIDVLYPYSMVSKEIASTGSGKSLMSQIANMYAGWYLNNLYAGAWDPVDVSPLKPDIPIAESTKVKECCDLIRNAKKPVLVIGSQATLPPISADDTRLHVEKMGIPVFLGGMARGLLGAKSNLQMRQKRGEALKDADVIILAGAICDFRLSYGRGLNRKAKVISINRSKDLANKNSDLFWKPSVTVEGDVGTFLKDLSAQLGGYQCPEEWLNKLREKDIKKDEQNVKLAETPTEVHLNPLKIFTELNQTIPENSVLVADGGDFVATSSYIMRPTGPLKWLDPGAFGTLGVGAGFALGAKLCRPDAMVWIIYGDGALGYSLVEMDTFVRHKLPVVALVGNDAGWTQIAREQVPMFGTSVACDLTHNSYENVAKAFEAHGILLKRGDNIHKVLQEAQEKILKDGKPVLINALIGRTSFRDGSISV